MGKKFGELVKEYRGKSTLKELSDKLSITSAYISDIEKGYRYPSKDVIDKMVSIFNLEGKKRSEFYDLAAIESPKKNSVSIDIINYIMENTSLRELIRNASNKKVKDEYWKKINKELIKERT